MGNEENKESVIASDELTHCMKKQHRRMIPVAISLKHH